MIDRGKLLALVGPGPQPALGLRQRPVGLRDLDVRGLEQAADESQSKSESKSEEEEEDGLENWLD